MANVGMGLLREQNPIASLAGDVTGGAALARETAQWHRIAGVMGRVLGATEGSGT